MLNILSVKKFTKTDLEIEFRKVLKEHGFTNPRLHGYSYLIDIIVEAIMNNQGSYSNTIKNSFEIASNKNNKSVTRITRCIYVAAEQAYLCDKTTSAAIGELYWDFLNHLYSTYCPENEEYAIFKKVRNILKQNGFVDYQFDGYFYILYILCESIKNKDIPYKNITLKTYPNTAKKFNTKSGNIERCIRYSISKSNFKGEDNKVVFAELYEQLCKDSANSTSEIISFVLKDNGFLDKSLDGYSYLTTILTQSLEENILPYRDVTTTVYPKIAEKYNKDWHNIDRSIRTAISQSNFKGSTATIVLANLDTQIKDLCYKTSIIEQAVVSVLKDNSFSKIYLEGYKYLKYILINAISAHTCPYRDMSTTIYPDTAKKFNVTTSSIGTAVYNVIKTSSLSDMSVSEAINKLYEDTLIKLRK